MAKVIAGMTTSVDGFVADKKGGVDRLYPDLAALQGTAYMNAAIAETGVLMEEEDVRDGGGGSRTTLSFRVKKSE